MAFSGQIQDLLRSVAYKYNADSGGMHITCIFNGKVLLDPVLTRCTTTCGVVLNFFGGPGGF